MLGTMRTMKPDDVPSAMELSTVANWNQTTGDWYRVMQLSSGGCRCIDNAGSIVATASLLPYGTQLAWIGMVLTRPEYRRQGLARRLMEDAISTAERSGIRTLKLDATDEGRPLYERLGFVVEEAVERWGRDSRKSLAVGIKSGSGGNISSKLSEGLLAQDLAAFGVDRRDLLEVLSAAGRCNTSESGYVLSRPGRVARYLGPCVAGSDEEVRQLIAAHLDAEISEGSQWYWDLLPANVGALSCATEFGFTRRRGLWRMRRGEVIRNNDAIVYAIAGFELG
ncbi:MAG: GNAT family N-acetyltransferase [Edaphobacter sp.]